MEIEQSKEVLQNGEESEMIVKDNGVEGKETSDEGKNEQRIKKDMFRLEKIEETVIKGHVDDEQLWKL